MFKAGRFASVGIEMGLCVAIGVLAGIYADSKFNTEPLFFWIGVGLGLGAAVKAVVDVVRLAKKEMRDDDDKSP